MKKLFSEFGPASAQQWKEQICKDLKGADFKTLVWKNPNGFEVGPFYTAGDVHEAREPLFERNTWEITEEIVVTDERNANKKALRALQGGASSLHFILTKKPDFAVLLNEISIQHIELNFILRYHDQDFKERFYSFLEGQHISTEKVNGGISFDGIANFVETGKWYISEEADLNWKNSWINGWIYQNAGATQSFELACVLAHAHEYLLRLEQKRKFKFSLSIGGDFFGEIAKLRALRKLWPLLAREYKGEEQIRIHACNSHLNQSYRDAYNNMLRTTTEGMSAVIGGCDSVTLQAYNKSFEGTNEFGERIARNQQLIFREESYLDKVSDMGAGSYYIESLTDLIAHQAWEEFKAIEDKGGFLACLRSNYIQDRIKHQAESMITEFRSEKYVLVGVNKFQNKNEQAKSRPMFKRINTGSEIMPLAKICLSDYLVKENA
jgi:methylmalonyl-CoA mutase